MMQRCMAPLCENSAKNYQMIFVMCVMLSYVCLDKGSSIYSRETSKEQNDATRLCSILIAKLVEHCTGIAEVKGSNPVEALIFFRFLLFNCLNWKIYCDDHSSL